MIDKGEEFLGNWLIIIRKCDTLVQNFFLLLLLFYIFSNFLLFKYIYVRNILNIIVPRLNLLAFERFHTAMDGENWAVVLSSTWFFSEPLPVYVERWKLGTNHPFKMNAFPHLWQLQMIDQRDACIMYYVKKKKDT